MKETSKGFHESKSSYSKMKKNIESSELYFGLKRSKHKPEPIFLKKRNNSEDYSKNPTTDRLAHESISDFLKTPL